MALGKEQLMHLLAGASLQTYVRKPMQNTVKDAVSPTPQELYNWMHKAKCLQMTRALCTMIRNQIPWQPN
eukprot:8297159-Ditylum_brightwellii.AAC.1